MAECWWNVGVGGRAELSRDWLAINNGRAEPLELGVIEDDEGAGFGYDGGMLKDAALLNFTVSLAGTRESAAFDMALASVFSKRALEVSIEMFG